jgi:adenine-specific DNA-methyltransferase
MEKMNGKSTDTVGQNIERLKELFPEVDTEDKIDFDVLRETLGDYIDDRQERHSFNWNGKSRARSIAQTPSTTASWGRATVTQ